jgi:hypothetical protein
MAHYELYVFKLASLTRTQRSLANSNIYKLAKELGDGMGRSRFRGKN